MLKFIKPFINFIRLSKKLKSSYLAYNFMPVIYTPKIKGMVKKEGDKYIFPFYDKVLSKDHVKLFNGHGEVLLQFLESSEIHFNDVQSNQLDVRLNGHKIAILISSFDNLIAIEEIIIKRTYDFHQKEEYIVFDVGMNIGIASLFFASFENIHKVYGYEPFNKTFKLAIQNINLNPVIQHKIKAYEVGLGKDDEILNVPEPVEGFLGGATSDFMIEKEKEDGLDGKLISINIKGIANEVKSKFEENIGRKIIMKLDCEGAEYDIIEKLNETKLLTKIDVFMIEYHLKGKESIVDILIENNFNVISPYSKEIEYGMIYAYNLN